MSDICYTVLIINVLQIASVNGKNSVLQKTFAFKNESNFLPNKT